jgi:hypothetical protein
VFSIAYGRRPLLLMVGRQVLCIRRLQKSAMEYLSGTRSKNNWMGINHLNCDPSLFALLSQIAKLYDIQLR